MGLCCTECICVCETTETSRQSVNNCMWMICFCRCCITCIHLLPLHITESLFPESFCNCLTWHNWVLLRQQSQHETLREPNKRKRQEILSTAGRVKSLEKNTRTKQKEMHALRETMWERIIRAHICSSELRSAAVDANISSDRSLVWQTDRTHYSRGTRAHLRHNSDRRCRYLWGPESIHTNTGAH